MSEPIEILGGWIEEAREAGIAGHSAMTLVTATPNGRPSARVVALKRLEADALVFTTALWTRKALEIERNPQVVLLFYWPELGRQANVSGEASLAERDLAEKLFAERDLAHQLQTIVSHQGETIDDLAPLREKLARLAECQEAAPACPPDWGAIRVHPEEVELWTEAPDRLHERLRYQASPAGWRRSRLAP